MIVAFMAGAAFGAIAGCAIFALMILALKEMNEETNNKN